MPRVLTRHAETPAPTHDAARDVGAPDEEQFDYDLTVQEDSAAPSVKTSFDETRYGAAEREDSDLISPEDAHVTARSGNHHWDGDDHEDLGAPVEDRSGPDPGRPFATAAVVIGVGALLWLLFSERKRR